MTQTSSPQETETEARDALDGMMFGIQITQTLRTAVDIGIAELLADGPVAANDLAAATGTDALSLGRLPRALAALGVLTEDTTGRFGPTPRSDLLRRDHPRSMRPTALFRTEAWFQDPFRYLTEAVRTGRVPFELVHGATHWQYLADHPDAAALVSEMLATRGPQRFAAVVEAYDFAGVRTLVDVGGGYGQLLVTVLQAHPAMRGVLLVLPRVVASAGATLEEGGVADRCDVIGGDMFTAMLPGGDAYVLSAVIHDWADKESAAILSNCRRAMEGNGRLLLFEQVAVAGATSPMVASVDLLMMVLFGQARQRTEAELQALLDGAGFSVTRVIPTTTGASIIEAAPA